MANYASLKTAIQQVVRTNGNNEITGGLLQQSLLAMIDSLGIGFQFIGLAIPSTNPGTPDQNVFYLAGPGTYPNFNSGIIPDGYLGAFKYNGSWSLQTVQVGKNYDDILQEIVNALYSIDWETINAYDGEILGAYIGSNGRIYGTGNQSYRVRYKRFNDAETLRYEILGASMGVITSPDVPILNNTYNIVASSGTGTFMSPVSGYVAWGYFSATNQAIVQQQVIGDIKDFATKAEARVISQEVAENVVDQSMGPLQIISEQSTKFAELLQLSDKCSTIMVDWMQVVNMQAGMTNVGVLTVLSSTSSAITLSATDAAYFTDDGSACVLFSDGSVKMVVFQAANGTSVAKNVNDPTDLSNAVKVQCLHDTPKGGGGIHLSQLGYIMLAQFTAQEINNLSNNRDKNAIVHFDLIGGNESFSNGKLYNHFGEQVATITSGGSISIFGNPTSLYGWFINQALYINSGVNGQIKIEFPANGRGRFCLTGLSKSTMSTNAVAGIIKLYADDTLVQQFDLAVNFLRTFKSNVFTANKKITIVIDPATSGRVVAQISNFGFYRFPVSVNYPAINSETTIAVLGDSWTQFPIVGNGISEYETYNERVVRPDGTNGDGYGYFPKELARVTGAQVDNWGKSNMTAENWGLIKIDEILAYKHYHYLVLEFFINDYNLGISENSWLRNLNAICDRCKAAGTKPIVIMPCKTNQAGYNDYGIRHGMIYAGMGASAYKL